MMSGWPALTMRVSRSRFSMDRCNISSKMNVPIKDEMETSMRLLILILIFLFYQIGGLFDKIEIPTAITNATLIDGTGTPPIHNVTIIMIGDRIAQVGPSQSIAIPPNSNIINAQDKFVIPGLIDTHLHLELTGLSDIGELPAKWNERDALLKIIKTNARLDLIAGFTTVRDLGSTDAVIEVRNEINSGKLLGPRIMASGRQLVRKSAEAHSERMFLEYEGPEDARLKVQYLASLGVDIIKIRLTHQRPVPSLDEIRAIVQEAHHLSLRATVHTDVPADDLVKLAIDAGADGIEHNAPLRSKDSQTLARMAQNKMTAMAGAGHFWLQRIDETGIIDSLDEAQLRFFPEDILSALHKGLDALHQQTNQMKQSGWSAAQRHSSFAQEIQHARKAGVLLVFGTDCGGSGMIHGEQYRALYGETQMGSSAMEAITMATRDAAIALGKLDDRGTIEPNKFADIVILNADPLADMRNLHLIFRVIKAGSIYDPNKLMEQSK
jgi:imidazolonepropionase-like amidohydrolase